MSKLDRVNLANISSLIFKLASECLSRMIEVMPEVLDGRTGGYFTVGENQSDKDRGYLLIENQIGTIPSPGKRIKYLTFSHEKIVRLMTNSSDDHVSSWQSRDTVVDKYAGAIRGNRWFYSFSGLPELIDEALCLWVAVLMEDLNAKEALAIAKVSNNDIYFAFSKTEEELKAA